MKPKQNTKNEAAKLVRDIKRATSEEIESSRTTKKPHRRHDEACCVCGNRVRRGSVPSSVPLRVWRMWSQKKAKDMGEK